MKIKKEIKKEIKYLYSSYVSGRYSVEDYENLIERIKFYQKILLKFFNYKKIKRIYKKLEILLNLYSLEIYKNLD